MGGKGGDGRTKDIKKEKMWRRERKADIAIDRLGEEERGRLCVCVWGRQHEKEEKRWMRWDGAAGAA